MKSALPTRAVLAATDLTEASDPVLRAAAALCALTGATLHVLHAFDLAPSPYVEGDAHAVTFPARVARSEADLRAQLARTVPGDVNLAEPRVEIYAAHRAITEYADAIGAELVVIGPHARREMEIGFLGGTADRVLRTLAMPCLVVRGGLRMPLRHVVVPMDLSEWSRAAMDVALAWSAGLGARTAGLAVPDTDVSVVHVVPRVLAGSGLPFQRAEVLPGWNAELDALARRAGPDVELRETVLFGDRPADEIVGFAEREKVDLVVMATHGYGAVKRALLGSTAQSVARGAPCPVLMVPPRMRPEDGEGASEAIAGAAAFAR